MSLFHTRKWLISDPRLTDILGDKLPDVCSLIEGRIAHINELVKIGLALSAEKNLNRLLEMIVSEARRFGNFDGGTFYILNDDDELEFAIVQCQSLGIFLNSHDREIPWPPIPLYSEEGSENHYNVSTHCALLNKVINIADVSESDFDFRGSREFDEKFSYQTKSMVVVPLRNHEDDVVGVLQLINVIDPETGRTITFPDEELDYVISLASQAAIAITNTRLVKDLEGLLKAFVKSIATAIDAKSPYTSGHISRVADLASGLAREINASRSGPFAEVFFSSDEMAEIDMAAWLHDVGKIVIPEHVVDKATKLQTVVDRLELIRCRYEIIKRDAEIAFLRSRLGEGDDCDYDGSVLTGQAEDDLAFLAHVNQGGEYLDEDSLRRLRELAAKTLEIGGRDHPLLTGDELANLSVPYGTLAREDRELVNSHVAVGAKMLRELPFPKKIRNVPLFAGQHHEKLNGSGYPQGVRSDEIPLQGRIIAVADIFEALTAADRPYKHGKKISEAMEILAAMVENGEIDGDLCDLLVSSGLVEGYARKNLAPQLRDEFVWRGGIYSIGREEDEEFPVAFGPEDG